ncbi:LruC domain-containing protein [Tellurirhabdus rosea]|uniref:LruC domain-containing protein n=1 Tax=Tellurirhabdus rosea TaxID=2674997 RepID=UPI00225B48CB|nr:LruC domain-containing protein [Tellurirhabdus rosea]
MRTFKKPAALIAAASLSLVFTACQPKIDEQVTPNVDLDAIASLIPAGFSFATTQQTTFRIQALDNQNKGMAGIRLDVYAMPDNVLLFSGITNASGVLQLNQSVAGHISQVEVRTNFPSLPGKRLLTLSGTTVSTTLGGAPQNSGLRMASASARIAGNNSKIKTKGGWDASGLPNYLEAGVEPVSTSFLKDVQKTLPTGQKVNSAYLAENTPTTIILKQRGDVVVHFLHHNTDWANSLGYYIFDPANPPQTEADIAELQLIFPNISTHGAGAGALVAGHKVNIGNFPAGTGIGFFLIADAFRNGSVTDGQYTHFSHSALNGETDPKLKRHFVLLNSPKASTYILAAEDRRRDDPTCDGDFNDAVFKITTRPAKAAREENMPELAESVDTDQDGVNDEDDAYPTDPEAAANTYFPSFNTQATLAFEDMWPKKGDYDFNDLVLNYNIKQVLNAKNEVVSIQTTYKVKAIGASFKNGFGFELPVPASAIKRVTGATLTQNYITLAHNGTEAGMNKAQIIVFDNAADKMVRQGNGQFYNTRPNEPKSTSTEFTVTVTFHSGISQATLGEAPFNPYLIVNGERGREIHMPDATPTQKANTQLFGTLEDRSNPGSGLYYRDVNNMPWVLSTPVDFDYPIETEPITGAHLKFVEWAKTKGGKNKDWYLDNTGYRNKQKIVPASLRQ